MKRSYLTVGLLFGICLLGIGVSSASQPSPPAHPADHLNVAGPSRMSRKAFGGRNGKGSGNQGRCHQQAGRLSTLGTDQVARDKKDGYTIGYSSAGESSMPGDEPGGCSLDPEKDLEHLGLHLSSQCAVVQAGSPWKTFANS